MRSIRFTSMIRSTLMTGAVLAMCVTALAQAAPAAVAAPSTAAEYGALMGVAVHAAQEVAAAEAEHTQLMTDIAAQVRDRRRIEASPCINPAGSTTHCAAYDASIDAVNLRREALLARGRRNSQRLVIARSNFGMAMARFRVTSVLPELEPRRLRTVACAGLVGSAQVAACLDREWHRAPPVIFVIETEILSPDPQPGMKSRQTIVVDFADGSVAQEFRTGTTHFFGVALSSVRNSFRVSNVRFDGGRATFTASGETASGVRVLPNINYRFDFVVDQEGALTVSGCHDGYPAYTITASNRTVYNFRHQPMRQLRLFGACDIAVRARARFALLAAHLPT